MIAALATIVFLASLWLAVVLSARMMEESGAKILAALRGQSPLAMMPVVAPPAVRVTLRPRQSIPLRARPQLRAAA